MHSEDDGIQTHTQTIWFRQIGYKTLTSMRRTGENPWEWSWNNKYPDGQEKYFSSNTIDLLLETQNTNYNLPKDLL